MSRMMKAPKAQPNTSTYWMAMDDGNVGAYEIDGSELSNDLEGEKLCTIIGYTDEFTINTRDYGEKEKRKWLLEVVSGEDQGARFDVMFGNSVHVNAKMNEFLAAARKRPIDPEEQLNLDDFLGAQLYVVVQSEQNDRGYWNTYYKASRPVKERPARPPAAKPAPRPVMTANGRPSDDPFDGDDEA